jgi:hypothetical protein
MKTRKISAYGLIAVILALTLTTCDNGGSKDPAHTHEWEWVVTTPATPTADGLETETCKTCGETRGTKPIAKLSPEHTHDYGTAWKSNATQHWRECSCGDKTDVADHEWEWQETTTPTITTDGVETRTCTTCGVTETRTGSVALATPFFGIWVSHLAEMTINANLYKEEWEDGSLLIMDTLVWEVATNTEPISKDEYSSGYKITGTSTGGGIKIGQEFSVTFFINEAKDKLHFYGVSGNPYTLKE